MAVIRTKRLGHGFISASGAAGGLGAVPSGHRYLIKGANIVNASAGTRTLSIYVGGAGGDDFIPWWEPLAANKAVSLLTYFVLEAGDQAYIADGAVGAGAVSVTLDLFGIDFTL